MSFARPAALVLICAVDPVHAPPALRYVRNSLRGTNSYGYGDSRSRKNSSRLSGLDRYGVAACARLNRWFAASVDAMSDRSRLEKLRAFCEEQSHVFFAISSQTGEGVDGLRRAMAQTVERIKRESRAAEPVEQPPA